MQAVIAGVHQMVCSPASADQLHGRRVIGEDGVASMVFLLTVIAVVLFLFGIVLLVDPITTLLGILDEMAALASGVGAVALARR